MCLIGPDDALVKLASSGAFRPLFPRSGRIFEVRVGGLIPGAKPVDTRGGTRTSTA
jgi:hypothetical protein